MVMKRARAFCSSRESAQSEGLSRTGRCLIRIVRAEGFRRNQAHFSRDHTVPENADSLQRSPGGLCAREACRFRRWPLPRGAGTETGLGDAHELAADPVRWLVRRLRLVAWHSDSDRLDLAAYRRSGRSFGATSTSRLRAFPGVRRRNPRRSRVSSIW